MAVAAEHPCKIFVGNLPFSMTQNGLAGLFRPYGTVVGSKLVEDRSTGKKKGFGFITFEAPDSVDAAIAKMHSRDCEGRQLTVKRATMRGEKAQEGDDEEEDDDGAMPSEDRRNEDEWGTVASKKKGSKSFKARAEEKTKAGKVLGWGSNDDDWA
mmetsp:Transcript_2001/g.3019  ORF Transcript_2001/g.3019 Transcript_2001/m.3019 type:complete len:155 (-) Transcript_2001:142-606(-)